MVPTPIELKKTQDQGKLHYRGEINDQSEFTQDVAAECVRILNTIPGIHSIILEIKNSKHLLIVTPGYRVWLTKTPSNTRLSLSDRRSVKTLSEKKLDSAVLEQLDDKDFEVYELANDMKALGAELDVRKLLSSIGKRLELSALKNLLATCVNCYGSPEQLSSVSTMHTEELRLHLLTLETKIRGNYIPLLTYLQENTTPHAWDVFKLQIRAKKSCGDTCSTCSNDVREKARESFKRRRSLETYTSSDETVQTSAVGQHQFTTANVNQLTIS